MKGFFQSQNAATHGLILAGCVLLLSLGQFPSWVSADVHYYDFVLKEINVSKLCLNDTILTVNGFFPGPVIRVRKGDTVYVNVTNQGHYGVTLHWHGVKQPKNSWSDGPVFVTQCPIQPGANFTYEVIFSDEEGTLWWHAHSDWTRVTVHGAIVILPEEGTTYPFPEPDGEEVIVLGSWYNGDLHKEINEDLETHADIPHSNGYLINGELGDFANCSRGTTYRWSVDYGKRYLLRIVNAVVDDELFFAIGGHNITVVGWDGSYVKPVETSYIMLSPGNTMDVLLTTNRPPGRYYMASRQFLTESRDSPDGYIGSAIIEYTGDYNFSFPNFPNYLPQSRDMKAAMTFTSLIKSLANEDYPISVPMNITTRMFITVSMSELCSDRMDCNITAGSGNILASSMNNISWVNPTVDILQAYYRNISGYYTTDFPDWPLIMYNFTKDSYDYNVSITDQGTKVKVLNYNESAEIVFQGTALLGGASVHPMHMHGYGFYVVGMGEGNFNNETDPLTYNLVDPPKANTFIVPRNGWLAIRFVANNPGVWLWHCHLERHLTWGMDVVFIVKNGDTEETSLRPPPPYMPPCTGYPNNILTKKRSYVGDDQDYL
ncbi:putative laccase-9 [Punica granatum]|uniref:Laccase n=1 Tax=Punica granatum TaxID=22663 RepID=A0A6P8CMP6_PUNGR|nr:putative laccase-9 [Punica granatum]